MDPVYLTPDELRQRAEESRALASDRLAYRSADATATAMLAAADALLLMAEQLAKIESALDRLGAPR